MSYPAAARSASGCGRRATRTTEAKLSIRSRSSRRAGGGGVVRYHRLSQFTIAPGAPVANQPVLFTSTSGDS